MVERAKRRPTNRSATHGASRTGRSLGAAASIGEDIPRRTPPNTQQGWETRERLVDAAIQEFLQHGYVRARVESIAERAGVGYGTFYRYFTSKVDLIRHLAEETYGELYQTVMRQVDEHASPAARAYGNILSFFRAVAQNREPLLVLEDAVGAEPVIAAEVLRLRDNYAHRYGEKIGATTYHPVGDHQLIGSLAAGLGTEAARYWLRMSAPDAGEGDQLLDQIARISTIMNLAIVDPGALGISPGVIEEIMTGLQRPPRDGADSDAP